MINAEVLPIQNGLYLVRFSEPDESFKENSYITIAGMDEVKRRVYFKNRRYILDKLTGWVKQRQHAGPLYYSKAKELGAYLDRMQYPTPALSYLCAFVAFRMPLIEAIAPQEGSRCLNHYKTVIQPILDFCKGEANQDTSTAVKQAVL